MNDCKDVASGRMLCNAELLNPVKVSTGEQTKHINVIVFEDENL